MLESLNLIALTPIQRINAPVGLLEMRMVGLVYRTELQHLVDSLTQLHTLALHDVCKLGVLELGGGYLLENAASGLRSVSSQGYHCKLFFIYLLPANSTDHTDRIRRSWKLRSSDIYRLLSS